MFWAEAKLSLPGAARALNETTLLAVPPGVVTRIGPVVTPFGAVALICVGEAMLKEAAASPLNVTAVAPPKPVPVMMIEEPPLPLVGVKPPMVGAAMMELLNEPGSLERTKTPLMKDAGVTNWPGSVGSVVVLWEMPAKIVLP